MESQPSSPNSPKRETNPISQQELSLSPESFLNQKQRVENIIYNNYIQQQQSTELIRQRSNNNSRGSQQCLEQIKNPEVMLWDEMRKQFKITMSASINQLYTNEKLITYVIHYLMGLPFIENSKKIIKSIVEYYDPSRVFIKSLIQSLVPALENQQQSELNKINVILYTLNALFVQQSPQNPKFNCYIYLNGGEGIKVQQKIRWPFKGSGTICLWYNMSQQTKQCKLFEISGQKTGFQIVVKNKKIYFEKIKEKQGFSLIRTDSAFLCEAETNKDIRLWIQFETKKKFINKALFINVVMNNFVLNNIQVDMLTPPTTAEYSINLFKNFHGKVSSALIFTRNLTKQVQNLNSKQGFIYESDIKNFSYMFDDLLSHVLLLYTSIRAKTYTMKQQRLKTEEGTECQEETQKPQLFDTGLYPLKTVVFDALNGRQGVIGSQACVYRNISIHKKEISLYGGLPTYLGFFKILKQHAKYTNDTDLYSQALSELILLFKNIFQSKTTTIEQAESIDFFRIMSNFFIETQMAGYTEQITPKLKELYVSLNNRVVRQQFIKKFIWSIPAGEYLQISVLENYLNLVKGFYIQEIQSSLNIFNVRDIVSFIVDKYDRNNCCFEHERTSSIDHRKKIKKYPQVLQKYFHIIDTIIEIKREDEEMLNMIIHDIISCFRINASPCFTDAVVKFISSLFQKDATIQAIFISHFQTNSSAKMGIFSALANSYSWKTKANIISLILHIYGVKMFREGGQKDLLTLCVRFPTFTARFSSIKSQDIERSVDMSEDKFSFNSTGVRTVMAMRPLALEQMVQLNDEDIIKVIWDWGTKITKTISEDNIEDYQNPGTLLLADLYKGSTYKIRKLISSLFLENHDIFLFTPDLMAWVIQCLLLCEFDERSVIHSDQIIYQNIQTTKSNLLKLISIYRISIEQQEESVENELDIIKLILIAVKSKYTPEISKLSHLVYLQITEELITSFHQQIKLIKFQSEQSYQDQIKNILSNVYRFILEHFIHNDNEDFQFQDESEMEQNEKEYKLILKILEKVFEILLYLAAPGNGTLMEQANAKRNQIMFELLFPQEGMHMEVPLMTFIFVCLQGLFDNYDDQTNLDQKKLTLTLIKKFLIFMIEIAQNSGSLKLDKYQQSLEGIFLNTLGFLQNTFCEYYFMEGNMQRKLFKNIEQIKNLVINIFFELIQLMRYIQEASSTKHRSFYQLMKPKKKHKNIYTIKNTYPTIWKKYDDHFIELMYISEVMSPHLSNNPKNEECKSKLQEHLKMKRLLGFTKKIEKEISKTIEKLLEHHKKISEVTQKNSVFSYQRNESEKCKIYTEYEEKIAVFMFENNGKQNRQNRERRIKHESLSRKVQNQQNKIWKYNRTYEGLWANPDFYSFAQNNETFLYDNTLSNLYRRVRSDRQSKYLLKPFITIEPIYEDDSNNEDRICDDQVFTIDQIQEQEQKQTDQPGERRRSDKYLQVGFQFLKKKVIEKIKKTALLARSKSEEESPQEKKLQQYFFKDVLLIEPMQVHSGTLKLDNSQLEFHYRPSSHIQHISLLKNKQKAEDQLTHSWPLASVQAYQVKRYMLKQNSIEFYFKEKYSILISFYGSSQHNFVKFVDLIQKVKKIEPYPQKIPHALRLIDPSKHIDKFIVTELWKNRQMTNFQYILTLNILSGRTNCDLNQYFIFPWILADYRSSKPRKDQAKYRDLEKNMGSLGTVQRMQKFIDIKNNIDENLKEEFAHSHHFGFHYSNMPIVLQFLIRMRPYAQGAMQLQGGKFDIPDRLFTSISDSFKNASSQMSDVRQLIPEFYYFPEFLINCQDFKFGTQQNNKEVNNVELPDGHTSSYDFIQAHREELESETVSQNLHKWIDLVFGYKQYGKEAELACNKFHYLSYENNAQAIFQNQKGQNKESIESQISYFGKVPSQLFTKPHPKRNSPLPCGFSQYTEGYLRADPFVLEKPILPAIQQQLIRHPTGFFSNPDEASLHFRYSPINKKYLILRRDGKGLIFSNQKSQLTKEVRPLSFSSAVYFQIFLDKYQYVYIFDESLEMDRLPICSMWAQHLFVGGLWGGKILRYDLITKQTEIHTKHSDTVTAITSDQQLALVVSGTVSGQIIVWQYINKNPPTGVTTVLNSGYTHSSRKLIYKHKIVAHTACINNIHIHSDLRVATCSGQDGLVSVIDVQRYEVIRTLKLTSPVKTTVLLSFPYYMFFIACADNRQFCYSLNGQFLDEANLQNLHPSVKICTVNGYQEKLMVKCKEDNWFTMLKMPEMREELRVQIKKDDNQVTEFEAGVGSNQIEVIFLTGGHLVHCNNSLNQKKGQSRKVIPIRNSTPDSY